MEVFFCTIDSSDELRSAMAETCLARWNMVEAAAVFGLSDYMLGCSALGFQRIRRIAADQQATGDIYIVADDDCLLAPDFDLNECVRVFKESGFSTLSLMPSNCTIAEWTPEGYITENTPHVMEHQSAGHVRFCRKGHLSYWPPMEKGFPGYDRIHGDAIRKTGGRTGYFRHHKQLHLGEGFTTVWTRENLRVVAP